MDGRSLQEVLAEQPTRQEARDQEEREQRRPAGDGEDGWPAPATVVLAASLISAASWPSSAFTAPSA